MNNIIQDMVGNINRGQMDGGLKSRVAQLLEGTMPTT